MQPSKRRENCIIDGNACSKAHNSGEVHLAHPTPGGVLPSCGRPATPHPSYKCMVDGGVWLWRSTVPDRSMLGFMSLVNSNRFRSTKESILGLGRPRGMELPGGHNGYDERSKWLQGRRHKK